MRNPQSEFLRMNPPAWPTFSQPVRGWVARLEAPVSSAVPAPVIAVIEYSYEHEGEIVLPAGTRVFGKLSHVTPSGFVGFQFDRVETPDGSVQKIDATAMDLKFGPLKGSV